MSKSIWKWGNTVHITKMGIEGTVVLAYLATAITTVLIDNIVAAPDTLALISTISYITQTVTLHNNHT